MAERFGVTPAQVKEDISETIREGMKNRDSTPESQALWNELSPDGKEPSVEEFLLFCTLKANEMSDEKSLQ